jgi:Tfp pilus assembly protein PilF
VLKYDTVVVAALVFAAFSGACSRNSGLPAIGSQQYRDLCAAFYLGLAALQSGEDVHAREGLERSTRLAPAEPVGWADLGILQVRQQELDAAFNSVDKARSLAPDNSPIESLLGLIESKRGKVPEAMAHFQRAVSLDGGNLKALYSLAEEKERQGFAEGDRQAEESLNRILKTQPDNVAVLLELARLAAKRGDTSRLREVVDRLRPLSQTWPDRARMQFSSVQQQTEATDVRTAAVPIQFLRNVLIRVPDYRRSLDQVKTPSTLVAEPFVKFLRLPSPSSEPAPPDTTLRFERRPSPVAAENGITWVGAITLDAKSDSTLMWADSKKVHIAGSAALPLPGSESESKNPAVERLLAKNAIAGADLNYDFKTDIIVATPAGLRLYQQIDPQHFKDVTQATHLPREIVNAPYTGAWAFDIDLDGDLDIVLGAPDGEPVVLRNNGDGTFAHMQPFKGVDGLREFAAADIDGDGDPDVALLDRNGKLTVFSNQRLGAYRRREVPASLREHNLGVSAADVNGDGLLDFVILTREFSVLRLSDRENGIGWDFARLGQANPPKDSAGPSHLTLADLDNNGALDLIVGNQVFLSNGKDFVTLPARLSANCQTVIDSHGRLNIVGLIAGSDGTTHVVELKNQGSKNYYWQVVRPRAAQITGDQRINSFGIGGEIEIRSGLLTQKQIISSPVLHFGLGDRRGAEFARIEWPNGLIQTEFDLKANETLLAEQRLKGSCPLLFAWNGHSIQFVKDVAPMSGALGAHDASGRFAAISQTREWFKIASDQLQSRDGLYDLRLTNEYSETYYIDYYGLLAVDHPAETHIFVDERVAEPAVPSRAYVTSAPREFQAAKDDRGSDVSTAIRDLDGTYLNTFQLGAYQGIAHDHWVELELPPDAPKHNGLYLIGDGWLHPWDDNILVAVNQGCQEKPQDLSIEVPDRNGHWSTAKKNLGVPAGRLKTVVLDLTGIFKPGAPRKLRLRTNLEIYWDRLAWASGLPASLTTTEQLPLASAELRYRGFSQLRPAIGLAPEVSIYDRLSSTGGKWRNLEGYYTRYGDVSPLLNTVDGRFVIAGSGDELRLKFHAAPPVKPAWTRDYIFVGDGWMKEGDYNFKDSETVLPLPSHAVKDYMKSPSELEEDPVYRLHAYDWQTYHTRYITQTDFLGGLWGH